MSIFLKAATDAYKDNKRETLNSLLRVTTPFPKREAHEEIAVKTASCACFPFKCLEGLGMITCGLLLWPIPCTVCKIETEHNGTDVSVTTIYPGTRRPNIPCHYDDEYRTTSKQSIVSGRSIPCSCGQRPEGEIDYIKANSSLTGYDCLSSGVGKIVSTVFSMLCCPFSTVSLACCGGMDD